MLLKSMTCSNIDMGLGNIYLKKEKMKKKQLKKIKRISISSIIVISILFTFNSFATNLELNDDLNNPANGNEENVEVHKFIYRTYDQETKKKLDDYVIEYDELEELIHNYNPNIMSMWNTYKKNKNSTEVYDDYMEAYYNLMAAGDSSDSDAMKARMYAQAYSMKILADNNVNDSMISFMQNELDEIKLYLDTKKKYLNYFITNYNYQIAILNEKEAARLANASKVKYDVGVDTEISYLQAQKNNDDAKANLALAESNKNVAEKNIKVACGKSTGKEISIGQEPEVDIIAINFINLEEDIKKAIDNNLSMKLYKRSFNNATTDEVEKHYEILIIYANEEITNAVKNYYSTLQNQNISLATKTVSYLFLIEQLNKGKGDLKNGKISEADFASLQYNVDIAKYQIDIQKLNLISAYEDYKYAVERGIASAILN